MTRRRQQYRLSKISELKTKPISPALIEKPQEITFKMALNHFLKVVWWRLFGERWIGKKCLYEKKYRKIIAEDYGYFFLEGFKDAFPKSGNKFKTK